MGAVQLLPGGGARYTSEVFTSNAIGADTIDCQMCSEIAVQQILTGSGWGGTFQLQEKVSQAATSWANLGNAITVAPDGTISKFMQLNRPELQIRINCTNVTGLTAANTLQLLIQGGRVAGGSTF